MGRGLITAKPANRRRQTQRFSHCVSFAAPISKTGGQKTRNNIIMLTVSTNAAETGRTKSSASNQSVPCRARCSPTCCTLVERSPDNRICARHSSRRVVSVVASREKSHSIIPSPSLTVGLLLSVMALDKPHAVIERETQQRYDI